MISLPELQRYLNSPDEHDTLVIELEESAVSIVETWQGIRYPVAGTQTEYIRGLGVKKLYLTLNPTADPSEVREREDVGNAGTVITTGQADGWVRRDGFILVRKQTVWQDGFEYQVTYAGGYTIGAEPSNVRQGVKAVVNVLYNRRGAEVAMTALERIDQDNEITDLLTQLALPRYQVFA